jgi:hypothetical protein
MKSDNIEAQNLRLAEKDIHLGDSQVGDIAAYLNGEGISALISLADQANPDYWDSFDNVVSRWANNGKEVTVVTVHDGTTSTTG